jgi:subtilase family serine protease
MQNQDWQIFNRCIVVAATTVLVVSLAGAQKVAGYQPPRENRQPTTMSTQNMVIPASSVERAADAGKFAHSNIVLGSQDGVNPHKSVTPFLTETETPASMGCVYKVGPVYTGCNPSSGGTRHPSGGWGAIAIVDAYDNPYAAYELATFDSAFGLPAAKFTKVYANGNGSCTTPPFNAGWGLEESLDIEWAHVMAPAARIILVEACSNSYTDLLYAEYVAGGWVAKYGGGDISNSWGSGEFGGETSFDPYFGIYYYQNTSYFASAGDSGCGAAYPSSSPWIVSAGGTTVNRDGSGNFANEACWAGSGGGFSGVEIWSDSFTDSNMGAWADYQYPIFGKASRQTPDISFNADPASGVEIFDCAYASGTCYYYRVGGTSVSSPSLAGIVNSSANKLGTACSKGACYYSAEENNLIYADYLAVKEFSKNYYDVTAGSNGCSVGTGWDYCTGVGSPRGKLGK